MTRVILAAFFLAFTSNAISQAITVTHTFQDATTASAAEVNKNFNDVVTGVNAIVQKDAQFNTATGADLLQFVTTGEANTANGYQALFNLTTGNNNTASGGKALFNNTEGNNNTAIGVDADVTTGALTNATAIGYKAKVNASNKVRIGSTSVTVIEGQVAFTTSSDARLKEDIATIENGLAFIKDLNPVSYHRINSSSDDIEMGLLAQEVQETLAAHGLSKSGMVHHANEDAYRSVRYNDLLAPMIRAIQELDDAAESKDQQIASLEQRLQSQQEELLAIVQSHQEQIAQLQRMVEHQFVAR